MTALERTHRPYSLRQKEMGIVIPYLFHPRSLDVPSPDHEARATMVMSRSGACSPAFLDLVIF